MHITAVTLLAVVVLAIPAGLAGQTQPQTKKQPHYTVINLGSFGGTNCCFVITNNNRGWVDGTSNLAGDQNFHPFLWRDGQMTDLGTLGGPNSSVGSMNERGDVTVGGSDTGTPDPLGEDACGFGTFQTCLSFVWNNGNRTMVPLLGGNNANVAGINNRRRVAAVSETATPDPTCVAPQVLGRETFIWELGEGEIRTLPPFPGDSATTPFDLNDHDEVIGVSGTCGNQLEDFSGAAHALLWKQGQPIDLGNLGGTPVVPFGINNRGEVAGASFLQGNTTYHAFFWNAQGGMQDLGTLPGDFSSVSGNINDEGQVPIESCDASGNCRAAIWQDGVMTDLNTLICPNSSLYLVLANFINSRGGSWAPLSIKVPAQPCRSWQFHAMRRTPAVKAARAVLRPLLMTRDRSACCPKTFASNSGGGRASADSELDRSRPIELAC